MNAHLLLTPTPRADQTPGATSAPVQTPPADARLRDHFEAPAARPTSNESSGRLSSVSSASSDVPQVPLLDPDNAARPSASRFNQEAPLSRGDAALVGGCVLSAFGAPILGFFAACALPLGAPLLALFAVSLTSVGVAFALSTGLCYALHPWCVRKSNEDGAAPPA